MHVTMPPSPYSALRAAQDPPAPRREKTALTSLSLAAVLRSEAPSALGSSERSSSRQDYIKPFQDSAPSREGAGPRASPPRLRGISRAPPSWSSLLTAWVLACTHARKGIVPTTNSSAKVRRHPRLRAQRAAAPTRGARGDMLQDVNGPCLLCKTPGRVSARLRFVS